MVIKFMEIDYINGQKRTKLTGISKYQNEIHNRLNIKVNNIVYEPMNIKLGDFNIGTIIKLYLIYPLIVAKKIKKDNIKHITSQDLAYLLNFLKIKKTIITCHDLIPWAYEKNHSLIWKNNIKGLKKADEIITVSQFSKSEIVKYVKYPEKKIHVIPNGVDHNSYYKNRNKNVLKKLNIELNNKIILYVGTEQHRMNFSVLVKSFAKLKKILPNIKLLKIGNPHSNIERRKILNLISDLNLQKDVIFTGYVLEEELPKWYNAADLLVYPCAYAGFGLPPLEAMACGTPVITSNTSSLPEVVGDAGIMVNPNNIEELTKKMYEVLTNDGLSKDMSNMGLKRAKLFNWDKSAQKTLKIYKEIYYGD
jgi:glycosyltransferase involved in cell wall biosynthesis